MTFNSLEFAVFLPIVFSLYWFALPNQPKAQNALLLASSYVFYGWWNANFLLLIAASTVADYGLALLLARHEAPRVRKACLAASLVVNLGTLATFKYFDFFSVSISDAFSSIGISLSPVLLNWILPVGISFYTFQTLSYTIDVYRRKLAPTKDLVAFAAFVGFFPQLVAGPIERATSLLPPFLSKRTFRRDEAVAGLREILLGLFQKVVVADTCARHVDLIFENYRNHNSATLALGAIYFAAQIYGDFAGYSNIAIGTARLFGFKLMTNFATPYLSRDIAEFWRRWHISLSTWFRDYVYIPLGGSRGTLMQQVRNVSIVFLISGLWHGANWTFIIWGGLNAAFFLPGLLRGKHRTNLHVVAPDRTLPSVREVAQIASTFALTCVAWIFFRAEDLTQAVDYLGRMLSPANVGIPVSVSGLPVVALMFLVDWCCRHGDVSQSFGRLHPPLRWSGYLAMSTIVLAHIQTTQDTFIYFQF